MKLPDNDLDYIVSKTSVLWEALRGQSIFITGGTGFFGCWLLESLLWANIKLKLNCRAVVLTRNALRFKNQCPHLFSEPTIELYDGDVQNFIYPKEKFAYIIHAASDIQPPEQGSLLSNILQGTRHILNFAKQSANQSFLFVSSGAVYGKQPNNVHHLTEDLSFSSTTDSNYKAEYGPAKQQSEMLCDQYANEFNLNIKIARCFSFVGPGLSLDAHFAISNFIRNGLNNTPILVKGDVTSKRSWLYSADLVIWLWTILLRGQSLRPYNVGSDEAYTIGELAHRVANCFHPSPLVRIQDQSPFTGDHGDRYVPSIERAKKELGLSIGKHLDDALQTTINWYVSNGYNSRNSCIFTMST